MDACSVSHEKLAFLVDTTAAPVAALSPVSTWIGFKLSVVRVQLKEIGVTEDGLSVLIRAIPSSIYPILSLVMAAIIAVTGMDYGPMALCEWDAAHPEMDTPASPGNMKEEEGGEEGDEGGNEDVNVDGQDCRKAGDVIELGKQRAANALLPVCAMVIGTVSGIATTGLTAYYDAEGQEAKPPSMFQVKLRASTSLRCRLIPT